MSFTEPIFSAETNSSKDLDLGRHVVDKNIEGLGNKDVIAQLKGANFGCVDVEISRAKPPVFIDHLVLERGCSKVLIGPNGSGKSTIFDAIQDVSGSDAYFDTHDGDGGVLYGDSVHLRDKCRISRLDQEEVLSSVKDLPARQVLADAVKKFKAEFPVDWADPDKYDRNLASEEAKQRIEELQSRIIKLFNIEECLDRRVSDLSGGEKTKLAIFTVLLSEPDVLLLDEPTNHLDLESMAKLAALFKAYNEAGVSILSVSHVDWFLREAGAGGVMEIKFGENERRLVSSSAPYDRYIRNRTRQDFTIIKNPLEWRNAELVQPGTYFTTAQEVVSVPESPLKGFSLDSLQAGEVWVLSGNNGAGKTKLTESMVDPDQRRGVFVKEKGVSIAYMPQFWPAEVAEGTLEDFFHYIKEQVNPLSLLLTKQFTGAIRKIGFMKAGESDKVDASWLGRKLSSFSGGEQRLLWFLAVSCFEDVDCLMLDEPTNHMDPNLQAFVIEAIRSFRGAVVFSTHDMHLLEEISRDIGKKIGNATKPRNVVLEKKEGRTRVTMSAKSPVDYMKEQLERAKTEAKKFKV